MCTLVVSVLLGVGCQRETQEAQQNDVGPIGYRAIAAMSATPEEKADQSIRTMSTADKVGQLMIVGISGTAVGMEQKDIIRTYRVGGIYLKHDNIGSLSQVKNLTHDLQTTADVMSLTPLFIGIDREALKQSPTFRLPMPERNEIGAQSLDNIGRFATRMGIELHDMGFNLNIGPTVNTYALKSYTEDIDKQIDIGALFAKHMADNHVAVAFKYFPGGDEYAIPGRVVSATDDVILDGDGAVFRGLIGATKDQYPLIMVNATRVPALDANYPVSISHHIVTDILRHQMGFDGVVISDQVTTGAAFCRLSLGEYAVRTIQSGSDILLVDQDLNHIQTIHAALIKAVEEGRITQIQLDQAVRRIMVIKYAYLQKLEK